MSFWRAVWWYLSGQPLRDLEEIEAEYRMTPIPKPPFRDDADRDASLGAALFHVTHTVTGRWPAPSSVKAAVELLTAERKARCA